MKTTVLALFSLGLLWGEQEHKLFPVEPNKAEVSCGRYFVRGAMALYYRYDLGSATGWGKSGSPTLGFISKKENPTVVVNRLTEPVVVKGSGGVIIQLPAANDVAKVRACLRSIR